MNVPVRGGVKRTMNDPPGSMIGVTLLTPAPLQPCTPS